MPSNGRLIAQRTARLACRWPSWGLGERRQRFHRRQVEARMAHIKTQPTGHTTVEAFLAFLAFLADGGSIYRE